MTSTEVVKGVEVREKEAILHPSIAGYSEQPTAFYKAFTNYFAVFVSFTQYIHIHTYACVWMNVYELTLSCNKAEMRIDQVFNVTNKSKICKDEKD